MAVIELYRTTGDRPLAAHSPRRSCASATSSRAATTTRTASRSATQNVVAGHAVRANYLYAGLADLVAETGDDRAASTCSNGSGTTSSTRSSTSPAAAARSTTGPRRTARPWQEQISRVHQAYGRAYQLPHTTAHTETCANIGKILWNERMLALTGDGAVRRRHRAASPTTPCSPASASTAPRSSTRTRSARCASCRSRCGRAGDTGLHPVPAPPQSDERLRERYLSCFCCPPNTARTLVAAPRARGIRRRRRRCTCTSTAAASCAVALDDGRVLALREHSDYPWDGRIEFTVTEAQCGGMPLHLRIPGWTSGRRADGRPGEVVSVAAAGTYTTIDRPLAGGRRDRARPADAGADAARPPSRRGGSRTRSPCSADPSCTASRSADLPGDVLLEQAALRRGTAFDTADRPRSRASGSSRSTTTLAVLPGTTDDALYADLDAQPLTAITARLVPYFAWGNRGPGEMSVWLPLVW